MFPLFELKFYNFDISAGLFTNLIHLVLFILFLTKAPHIQAFVALLVFCRIFKRQDFCIFMLLQTFM